ncbi:DNA cytosine methyltransferase [Serinicoccus sp. LYQ131]|uniref:DNA cytosine methyltransferase n=1 Tax=Serinicoccus sp. LYQ131 TaxID=3378797 RepID=UPI003852E775
MSASFRFIDLFAGVGGFHAAMKALGGECVYAVEIDPKAANVYEANWGHHAFGDITEDADADAGLMNVPPHDVLCAGFPCQPFSKSGTQRGMEETRGTLFFNIASIIKAHHPAIVLLENVRNLVGPRHSHEWSVIVDTLREEGYHVSERPALFSPHLLPPSMGGVPQVRERVFITATYAPEQVCAAAYQAPSPVVSMADRFPTDATLADVWDPNSLPRELFQPRSHTEGWNLEDLLDDTDVTSDCNLSDSETLWIDAWDEFVRIIRELDKGKNLPGHPIWADSWRDFPEVQRIDWSRSAVQVPKRVTLPQVDPELPSWKKSHLRNNYAFFARNYRPIVEWAHRWGLYSDSFPPSRRKLEWQAQDTPTLWDTVMHLRPSGIRAKKPTYLPALVAITQTSIVGPRKRRLTPRETARLQGLPDTFIFPEQPASATYRQMGNGVNVGAVWHVLRQHVVRDIEILNQAQMDVTRLSPSHPLRLRVESGRAIVESVRRAPLRPNEILAEHRPSRLVHQGDVEFFSSTTPIHEGLLSSKPKVLEIREAAFGGAQRAI